MTAYARTLLLALLFATGASGCGTFNPIAPSNGRAEVIGLPNQDVVELCSDDVVRVMRRAGFADSQILEMGTDLRNRLASNGAAQICVGSKVEAMFAVDGGSLYVTSRRQGTFIYDTTCAAFH